MLLGKYRITPQKNTNLGVAQSFKMWPQKETVLRQIGQPSFSDFHCVKDVDIKALSIGVENSINLMLFSTPLDSAWFVFSSDTSMGKNLVYCPELLNLLGPKSAQHQLSPNNISRSSKVKVMRITTYIDYQTENALILNQILSTNLKRNVWRSVWRICMWILGLKGFSETKICDVHL